MAKYHPLSVRMIAEEKGLEKNAVYRTLSFQQVRTDIEDNWVLHYDNAPPHTALSIPEFLMKKNIPVLPNFHCSPDLAPYDFDLFSKLKSKLKSHHFGTLGKIQKIVTDELHTQTVNDFR
jgi:hypothetical protein